MHKHESVAIVQSMDGTKKYRVELVRGVCECEDSHFRHMRCKHITASQITVGIVKVENDGINLRIRLKMEEFQSIRFQAVEL